MPVLPEVLPGNVPCRLGKQTVCLLRLQAHWCACAFAASRLRRLAPSALIMRASALPYPQLENWAELREKGLWTGKY